MAHSAGKIPGGVWAIGSDLSGLPETEAFLQSSIAATAITMRRPQCDHREALRCLHAMTEHQPFVAVHGHADLALAAHAPAVIVGVRSLPIAVYRDRFPDLLLGVSTHGLDEVEKALCGHADFLFYGPIWDTPEKAGVMEPRGLESLAHVCEVSTVPVIAIGGISQAAEMRACQQAGAHAVAVLRAARSLATMAELVQQDS